MSKGPREVRDRNWGSLVTANPFSRSPQKVSDLARWSQKTGKEKCVIFKAEKIGFLKTEGINLILIWVLSNNFNRFLKSWCELTWKQMLLRRGKPNPFPLFTGLPGWMCKASAKIAMNPWMTWGKIG